MGKCNPIFKLTNKEHYLAFYNIEKEFLKDYQQIKLVGNTVVHIFEPIETSKKTVFLMHGYFDHIGSLKNCINFFLRKGDRVIGYDLKGHGLSTGARGEIDDFNSYVQTFRQVVSFCEGKGFEPTTVVAHSTGAAICTQYLLQYRKGFESVIYLAPLVRVANWHSVLALSKVVPFFKQRLRRKFAKNSSDKNYLNFVKKDPLQCKHISVPWVLAMINWSKKAEELLPSTQKIYVIQGTVDETVAWKYNLAFLRKKFPFAQFALIEKGRHQIINDSLTIQKTVLSLLEKFRRQA